MKKIICLVLSVMFVLSLCGCGAPDLSPSEKLDLYITENGTEANNSYTLACPDAKAMIETSDFTIAAMKNLKGASKSEFTIVKSDSETTLELTDSSIADGGLKMERLITIALDGTFTYRNSLIMNGTDLGVYLEGEIPIETYNKENDPVITKSELATGAKLSDSVKKLLKDYINLVLDCFANELSKEDLSMTLADFGYVAYPTAE